MLAYTFDTILAAEEAARGRDLTAALAVLRRLCLDDFAELQLSMPNPAYPALSNLLPAMATARVQQDWTGSDGYTLLRQTLNFVKAVNYNFTRLAGRGLGQTRMLDFGCGYGRIARLMYYFTNPERFYGADPWDESIRLCRESRMPGHFLQSDYVPRSLPCEVVDFDLIYCFSVFTHLSEKTTRIALETLRRHVAGDGLLVITVRPEEYWTDIHNHPKVHLTKQELRDLHRKTGFAFSPHHREPIDGDVTYGDTSISLAWLEREIPSWQVVAQDRNLDDPYQILLFMAPR